MNVIELCQYALRRYRLRNSAVVMSALLLFGCASTVFKPAPLTTYPKQLKIQKKWRSYVGTRGVYTFTPVRKDDFLYVLQKDGYLRKINLQSGLVEWRKSYDLTFSSGLALFKNELFAGDTRGNLVTLSTEDGKVLWKTKLDTNLNALPLGVGSTVLTVLLNNSIVAFDRGSESKKWSIKRPAPPLFLRASTAILGNDAIAYIPIANGKMIGLEPNSGRVVWEKQLLNIEGSNELERLSSFIGAPSLSDKDLCINSFQGKLLCIDPNNGNTLWQRDFLGRNPMVSNNDALWLANERDIVYSYARENGTILWANDALHDRVLTAPALLENSVAFGDKKGYVHFFNRDNGSLMARFSLLSEGGIHQVLARKNSLFVMTKKGYFYRYDITVKSK